MKNQDTTAEAECVASNGVLYVLAGRYDQAVYLAREMNVPRDRLRYIVDERSLRGIDGRGKTLYVYGTAYERDDCYECERMAAERGFEVMGV